MSGTIVPLAEVAEVKLGRQRSPKNHDGPNMRKYLRAANVGWSGLLLDDVKEMNFTNAELAQFRLEPGDILLNEASGSPREVGKPALWQGELDNCAFQNTLLRVRPSEQVDSRYLLHFFRHEAESGEFVRGSRGTGINHLGRAALARWLIPLPPVEEQRRIAAILDHADALRAKRRAALARLDALTRSIFIDMFGHPAFNSKGLQTVSLGELGKWQSGGTPPRTSKSYFEGNIPWFSSGELNEMYVSVSHEQLTEAAIKETSAKAVPAGSLLLGMYDTAALKSSIATKDCSCNQAIAFASINPDAASTPYVYFAVAVGRDEFRRVQRGVRQKNLNLSMVKGIRIPSPPLAHQRAFEAHVGLVLDERVKHHTALTELDALFSSLQARAFRGEL
ncbi:MAG: restriction endonuclease subunit S [Rhodococcus sp.]|uniref:restriction endonuclease subunit S n=1 Tax=Rhodococcus yananensis TaxID=2879464 RepID=UPI0016A9DB4D|nr:restriction endonuclease subunit S [Rhodococcus yananensis]NLE81403.1 restriction endonuclease subunit S [Rhodococcus sp. (in: high G+C Gram-positive bacteria)]